MVKIYHTWIHPMTLLTPFLDAPNKVRGIGHFHRLRKRCGGTAFRFRCWMPQASNLKVNMAGPLVGPTCKIPRNPLKGANVRE